MSNAQNIIVYESTASYATIWTETNWKKVYKYVDKQRFRIFRAESEGDYRNGYRPRIISDKGLFEPYVLKGTRTVLVRVQGRNPLFLSSYYIIFLYTALKVQFIHDL